MTLSVGERFILLQAMIVRRVPSTSKVTHQLLMEALQADNELVLETRPDLHYKYSNMNISQEVDVLIEMELIEAIQIRPSKPVVLRRTSQGDVLLKCLEPRLTEALDDMPMSDVGMLDFLSLL